MQRTSLEGKSGENKQNIKTPLPCWLQYWGDMLLLHFAFASPLSHASRRVPTPFRHCILTPCGSLHWDSLVSIPSDLWCWLVSGYTPYYHVSSATAPAQWVKTEHYSCLWVKPKHCSCLWVETKYWSLCLQYGMAFQFLPLLHYLSLLSFYSLGLVHPFWFVIVCFCLQNPYSWVCG